MKQDKALLLRFIIYSFIIQFYLQYETLGTYVISTTYAHKLNPERYTTQIFAFVFVLDVFNAS